MGEAVDLSDDPRAGDGGEAEGRERGRVGEAPQRAAAPADGRAPGQSPPARSAPRLSYEAVVRLRCDGRRGIHTGFVRDISRGGMFLRLVDPEPAGRRLGFELFLPGWRFPARGVGEVAWQRPTYEGPGRPPGMAIRFVALEAQAISMLAAVLPDGEAPVVEVLERRRVQLAPRQPVTVELAEELPADVAPERPPASVDDLGGESLEALLAESGLATPPPEATAATRVDGELDEPMIFVPPPPLPVPLLPQPEPGPPMVPAMEVGSRFRWGSAAAGIAAFGAITALLVVGAVRREPLPAAAAGAMAETAVPEALGTEATRPPRANAAPGAPPPTTIRPGAPLPSRSAAASSPELAGPAAAARRLTGLRWEPLPAGGTRVIVALDGPFAPQRLRASRIGGEEPRLVVRLLGIGDGAPATPWEPATAEVRRIRAGRHDGADGVALHLVLDLASAAVQLGGSTVSGGELRLDLVRSP